MEEGITVDLASGFRFILDDGPRRECLHSRLCAGQLHEKGLINEFVRSARVAEAFLDIGAHVGWYASLAAVANPRIKILLIEPQRACLQRAIRNATRNGVRPERVIQAAAGATEGTSWPRQGRTHDSMLLRFSQVQPKGATGRGVPRIVVDRWLREIGIKPDIVKVDVEGAERGVLAGMRQLLQSKRPLLFVELHGQTTSTRQKEAKAITDLLRRFGYVVTLWDKAQGFRQLVNRAPVHANGDFLVCKKARTSS